MEEEASAMTYMNIPYLDLKAVTAQHEAEIQKAVSEVVSSGWYLQGKAVRQFEQHFAAYIGTKFCVGVANGLDALTLTLKAYKELGKLKDGAEIIVPANTFIATVLAITDNHLKPVFVDVDAATLEMKTAALEQAINEHTGAIMLVHLYGRCTYHKHIESLCQQHHLLLIEDNAQAHGCKYQGRKTGSLGNVGCHSFYPGKNLGALGDGGAITTDDKEFAEVLQSIANYGFERKYVAKYQGRNSRLDDIQAAVLDVKLKYLDEDNAKRQTLAHIYYQNTDNPFVHLPQLMEEESNVYHIFPIFTPYRDELQQHLQTKGIQTLIHYPIPPHQQECYRLWKHLTMPVTEQLAKQELSLPLNPTMTEEEVSYVTNTINLFKKL